MFSSVFSLSFLIVSIHGFALPFEGLYQLDIIHYNDFHARFEETSVATPTCRFNNNSCLGGFPRLYHEIQVLMEEKPDFVLLNAGDSFQGTYWYTLLKWNITAMFMNMLPHDAHKLSTPGKVKFTDPREATRREAQTLTDKGVDIIILLSHCGLDVDKELARDFGEHIDIIVGGHTHSLLWNGPSPSGEPVAGPYPIFVESAVDKKHKTMIVQASAFTKYMGNLTLFFDFRGDLVKYEGGPIFLDRSIAEDAEIKAKLAPYAEIVHKAENVPIGETKTSLSFEACVFGECALGDALVDSQNDYAKSKVKSSLDFLSFIQRGNIKSSIPQGTITEGTLFELLPFNDRMETFELQGKWVLEALERSVRDAWANHPFKGPWVLQVSGKTTLSNE
ncbi:apyrase-like isoform X2 [Ostrinia furnacalis]|uniref:apyrase-like isoform X2 n=1 Tax=Ostrinia furnacalis TaxID=93504 RepID=UPI001040CD7D|nr:apyrase-like isoform X2 [Ostrinia furnacalis]